MSRRVLFIWYRREDRGTAVGLQSGFAGIRSCTPLRLFIFVCRSDPGDARDEEGLVRYWLAMLNSGLLPTNAVTNSSIYGAQALAIDATCMLPPLNVAAIDGSMMQNYNSQMDRNTIVLAIRAREASLVSARDHLQAQIARAQLEDLTAILSAHSGSHSPGFMQPHETIVRREHPSTSHATVPVPVQAPSVTSKEQGDKSSCETKKKKSNKTPSKTKKKSPDDAPRRPLSAYNYFYIDEREKILQQKQEEAGTAVESTTAAGPIKNVKWEKTCNIDYDIEMSEPVREMLERQKLPPNEGRRRPHRKRHGVVSFQELAKTIASRWRSLPADQIQYYRKIASFDLKRYQAQMFDYNQDKLRREGGSSSPQVIRKSDVPKAA